jgi:hypothetical protein
VAKQKDEIRKYGWANMTNFEDGNSATIECPMNLIHGKNSIAHVIYVTKRCYVLTVFRSIIDDELNPLKFVKEK